MNSPTSVASNFPVVSTIELERRISQYANGLLGTLLQYPETAALARDFQLPQMQEPHVAIVVPEQLDEAEKLIKVLGSANVLGAARLTSATGTETQKDQLAHAMIYAVSDVNKDAWESGADVNKASREWGVPPERVVIVLQNWEGWKDGERPAEAEQDARLRAPVAPRTTILPLSVPLWEASQTHKEPTWTALCRIGREYDAKSLEYMLRYLNDSEASEKIFPDRQKDLRRLRGVSQDVIRFCAHRVRQESIEEGGALQQCVRRESGMDELKHRFAYLGYPDMPALVELLSVAKQYIALGDKAVLILEDVVRAETEEQEHANALRCVLDKLTAGQTAESSQRNSLGALQAAIDYMNTLQQDSQELEGGERPLLGDIQEELTKVREIISDFPVQSAFEALDRAGENLEAASVQAEKRVKTRQEQAEESRDAAMPIIEGLETVKAYLESGGHPPSGSDVKDAAQPLLDSLRTNSEKRLKMAEEVLSAVSDSHKQFEDDVDRFEDDIHCLIHLALPDTAVEEPDKTTLVRLFGRYGTDVTTRVGVEVPPEDPEFNKQVRKKMRALYTRVARQGEGNPVISHATEWIGYIYESLGLSGESEHDN